MSELSFEIAARAARWVVDEGMDYAHAKQRAARELGLGRSHPLPDNAEMEAAVRDHLAVFHGDTQPLELRALRRAALGCMERLEPFRPHLTGPVWSGTATRLNAITIQLFCDDPKAAEFFLLDRGIRYEARSHTGFRGEEVPALSFEEYSRELREAVDVNLLVYDLDDLRVAPRGDAPGRSGRGSIDAVRRLVAEEPEEPS